LRSALLSPSGQWLAYYNTFGPDPSPNGLWLISTDGSQRIQLDRELFGAYQWRGCSDECSPDEERLLIAPFRPDATFHSLWEVDPTTGEAQQITDPANTPFKIANGDWRVSPNGSAVVYVESSDRNIWVIQLPE
jgi:Tol biopolymer transport system component